MWFLRKRTRTARYPRCAHCGHDQWKPFRPAHQYIQDKYFHLRQQFRCARCGVKVYLFRRLDKDWDFGFQGSYGASTRAVLNRHSR